VASAPTVDRVFASVYDIPTDAPEADGTLAWDKTTVVVVEVEAAGKRGLGYTYSAVAAAQLATGILSEAIHGVDALAIPTAHRNMVRAVRNVGRPGLVATAISAIDAALWDLKGKLLGQPLAALLGPVREEVPVYGSGGFTNYSERRLQEQLTDWVEEGIRWVKMKVGSDPEADTSRVAAARRVIGDVGLFVDANGAYSRKQALDMAACFAEHGVAYFEEPVSSDDLAGLSLVRESCPRGMQVAAGEYGYDSWAQKSRVRGLLRKDTCHETQTFSTMAMRA